MAEFLPSIDLSTTIVGAREGSESDVPRNVRPSDTLSLLLGSQTDGNLRMAPKWHGAISTEDHGVFSADQLLNDTIRASSILTVKEGH